MRWEDTKLNKDYCFADFINEHWVRPQKMKSISVPIRLKKHVTVN